MSDLLPKSILTICEDMHSAISSQVREDGHTHCASPDGPMIDLFGQVVAPVKASASRARGAGSTTNATSGRNFSASSENAGPPLFLANKSQEQQSSRSKTCATCGVLKPFAEFYANKKGHTRKSCKECLKGEERSRKVGSKTQRSASFRKWREENRISALLTAARYRSRQRGLPFDLDEYRQQLADRLQKMECELTGIPLDLKTPRAWNAPSIDRIRPEAGYVISNVRIVAFAVNVMMNTWGEDKVLEIAGAMAKRKEEQEDSFWGKFERSLMRRLDAIGSTECTMTWVRSFTPAGQPVLRHVPSAPRISVNGSTGAPWTTPTLCGNYNRKGASETSGDGLATQVAATWATPTTRDWKDSGDLSGSMVRKDGKVRMDVLPRQAWTTWPTPTAQPDNKSPEAHLAMKKRMGERDGTFSNRTAITDLQVMAKAFGETPNGSQEPMAKRGALNPAFASWLMGFPPEHLNCAPSETRSARRSPPNLSKP
jgi:hypothetical protein